jgi:hypothetical protein
MKQLTISTTFDDAQHELALKDVLDKSMRCVINKQMKVLFADPHLDVSDCRWFKGPPDLSADTKLIQGG